jgi:hypothetical protein
MLLGTMIKQVMRAQGPFCSAIAQQDPELAERIAAEAGRLGVETTEFVADTVRRFMAAEDGESWTTIISGMQDADDPGLAFLQAVLRKRLSHACSH